MPFRGECAALVFSGVDADLLQFFSYVEMLGEGAGLAGAELIRWSVYYARGADAELWASLPEVSSDDWVRFRSAVVEVYPGVSEDRRYSLADLEQLVEERFRFPVKSKVELGSSIGRS